MKMITAIIKPFKLEDVREALQGIGLNGMTVEEARLAARKDTLSYIEAQNTSLISCQRLKFR